jgi:hypothetical protein
MESTKTPESNDVAHGLPRRRALQGIAGSLAGIAALGAVNASAKKKDKKKKKSNKGRFVQFRTAEQSATIPTATPTTVTVTCPGPKKAAAKKGIRVFATGGGYESNQAALTMFATSSRATSNGRGWQVTFNNAAAPQDASVSVVCSYFKTK